MKINFSLYSLLISLACLPLSAKESADSSQNPFAFETEVFNEVKKDIKSRAALTEYFLATPSNKEKCQEFVKAQPMTKADAAICYFHLGILKIEKNEMQDAKKYLENAVKFNEEHVYAYEALGDLNILSKNYPESLKAYGKAQEIFGKKREMGKMQILAVKTYSIYCLMGLRDVCQNMLKAVIKFDEDLKVAFNKDPLIGLAKTHAEKRLIILKGEDPKEPTHVIFEKAAPLIKEASNVEALKDKLQSLKNTPEKQAEKHILEGNKLKEKQDYLLALAEYFEALKIYKSLALKAPQNTQVALNYAQTLINVAEMQKQLKQHKPAVKYFTDALEVLQPHYNKMPENTALWAPITTVFIQLISFMAQDNEPRIVNFSTTALEIINRFAKAQPQEMKWNRALISIYMTLAQFDPNNKMSHLKQAKILLMFLKISKQANSEDLKSLSKIENELAVKV